MEAEKKVVGPEVAPSERVREPLLPTVNQPRSFLEGVGYKLTRGVLIGLFIVIFLFLGILTTGPNSTATEDQQKKAQQLLADCLKPDDTTKDLCTPARLEIAKTILAEPAVTAYREFWKSMFERIVGTTLLPILTALLGYLFGTQRGNESTSPKNPKTD